MATGMLTCVLAALTAVPAANWPANPRFDSAISLRNFNIPINVDPNRRQEIKELVLMVSTDQGKNWNEAGAATPDQSVFAYNAPGDGLYYFNLVIVDRQGRRDPADVRAIPPAMRVLIDTAKPLIRINAADRVADDVQVSWDITEENLELSTMKLEYRTPENPNWSPVSINQASSGLARFRVTGPSAVSVRMQVMDQARNLGTAQTEVAAPHGPMMAQAAPTGPAPMPAPAGAPPMPAPAPAMESGPQRVTTAYRDPNPPPMESAPAPAYNPAPPPPANYTPASATANDGGRLVASSENSPSGTAPAAYTGTRRGPLPPVHIVNNPQITLDYEVAKVGPSGVGHVELWMTQDDGRTWRRYAEDTDHKPPMTVDLPGEGVYGFCIVVQSKAGLGKRAPLAGDPPEMRVEVDTTAPTARLYAPEPDPKRPNALQISWTATDRNLVGNAITLQWAEKPNGTWETIGSDLPNTGHYTWQLPANLPYRVYLRLIVRDSAGNVCIAETPEPVLVDLNEPEARLTGLTGLATRRP